MDYPIVEVKTLDNITLYGLLSESQQKDLILINIHGTGSCFYVEGFEKEFSENLPINGISTLFTNNRGNQVMECWQETGAAIEKFEDCLKDIDAWIEFVLKKGYKKIILQGHSLGTEKVVYYMEKGKYKEKIVGVVLLGFSDSYGVQMKFLRTQNIDPMDEAIKLVENGKGYQFLTSVWKCHAGVIPQNAESYINFFSQNSELSKALPIRNGKDLTYYQNIKTPILGVICENDEWMKTITTVSKSVEIMREENGNAQIEVISDTDHSFSGKQKELLNIVHKFIKEKIIN